MNTTCTVCGASLIERIQKWALIHGGRPPTANDWNPKKEGWPSSSLVQRVFGSWSAGMAAAGFPALRAGGQYGGKRWTRTAILNSIRRFELLHDRLPVSTDWARPLNGQWPQTSAVVREFGSWSAAIHEVETAPLRRRELTAGERAVLRERVSDVQKEKLRKAARVERELAR